MQADERKLWLNVGRKAGAVLGVAGVLWAVSAVFLDEPLFRLVSMVLLFGGLLVGVFDPARFPTRHPDGVRALVTGMFVGLAIWEWIPPRPEAEMFWQPYSDSAVRQAAADGKPVMIDFFAEWCGPCHDLDRRVFGRTRVVAAAERFVRLRADMTDQNSAANAALSAQYDVRAFPTVVFIGSDGHEIPPLRSVGVAGMEDFLAKIRAVR